MALRIDRTKVLFGIPILWFGFFLLVMVIDFFDLIRKWKEYRFGLEGHGWAYYSPTNYVLVGWG
jgi:hypothetical protein